MPIIMSMLAALSRYRPPTVAALAASRDPTTNNFHLLRFIAASLVVLSHSYPLSGNGFADPLARWAGVMDFGLLAVTVFFVLSGFLVTQSATYSSSVRSFVMARILRIWPALIFATLFAGLIVGPLVTTLPLRDYFTNPQTYWYMLSMPLLHTVPTLPGVFAANPFPDAVNGSLWTIPVECWLYLLMAVALTAGMVKRTWTFNFLLLLLWLLWLWMSEWVLYVMPKSMIGSTPKLVGCFMLGALMYRNGAYLPVSLAAALGFSVLAYGVWRATGWYEPLMFLCIAYWVIVLSLHPWLTVRFFPRQLDYSYGIYVFAFPVQQALVALLGILGTGAPAMGVTTMFVLSYAGTLALAVVSWHLVESKALRLKRWVSIQQRREFQALRP